MFSHRVAARLSLLGLFACVAGCSSSSDTSARGADASLLPTDGGADAALSSSPFDATTDAPLVDATAADVATADASLSDATTTADGGPDASSADAAPDASEPANEDASSSTCALDGGSGVWCDRPVATGVVWRSIAYPSLFCGAQRINVIDVDFTQPGLSVRPVQGNGGNYETVSAMGDRTGAIAGINGGFFCNGSDDICTLDAPQPTCDPSTCNGSDLPASGACTEPSALSLLQIDGGSVSTNCKTSRATLGLDATGRVATIADVAAGAAAPEPNAVGAGPMLVVPPDAGSGPGIIGVDDEAFHWPCTMHPRTAVALDDRGHLLMVTFDGGYGATGVTLAQAASFLVTELHARQAMNFDGGGSTTLYVSGYGAANVPSTVGSDGGPQERAVYDGLFVFGP